MQNKELNFLSYYQWWKSLDKFILSLIAMLFFFGLFFFGIAFRSILVMPLCLVEMQVRRSGQGEFSCIQVSGLRQLRFLGIFELRLTRF